MLEVGYLSPGTQLRIPFRLCMTQGPSSKSFHSLILDESTSVLVYISDLPPGKAEPGSLPPTPMYSYVGNRLPSTKYFIHNGVSR